MIIGGSIQPTKLPSTTAVSTKPSLSEVANQQTAIGGGVQPPSQGGTIQTTPTTAPTAPAITTKEQTQGKNALYSLE